jgi:hypothetical protein
LVDGSEHSLAACALLDHLQKPDAEPSLRLPVSLPPKTMLATMGHVLTRDGLQGYVLTVNISYVILLMTMRLTSYESIFKYKSNCTESVCYNLQNLISL